MLKDNALIKHTLAGNTECFNILVDRHISAVRKRIRLMSRNTSDEDDLVQEVFLKAWRHLPSFRSDASFRTWITRIATNEVLQLHRKTANSPLLPATFDLDIFASPIESPERSLQRAETAQIVRRAIAGLPPIYRQIAGLRYLKQLSEEETARHMQASIALVKIRLFRARRLLSAALNQQEQLTFKQSTRRIRKNVERLDDERLPIAA